MLLLLAGPLSAEPRVALVIGNSGYDAVSSLDNPGNDARLIAQTLESVGFQVTLLIDSPRGEMMLGIREFGRNLRNAGTEATGLFYYAGHGVQSFGTNYLLPTDVAVSDPADLDLVAIEAQSVLRQMYSARNRTNIVILDACRNNPFSDIPEFNDNGLAEMQAPTGTFLSYATAPGGVALDGVDENSPFTKAVARQISTPGLPVEQLFKRVRVEVIEATQGQQTPWDASSLTTDFVFSEAPTLSAKDLEARALWNSVKESDDSVQIMLFLRAYSDTIFAPEARALLEDVMEEELAGNQDPKPLTPSGPSPEEQELFGIAQAGGEVDGYKSYLDQYPNGVFAEIARQEIAALTKGTGHDPIGEGVTPEPENTVIAAAPAIEEPTGPILFRSLLSSDEPVVNGRSIEQLIAATPLYPPIEGLPESFWKDQSCDNCHQWTQETICEQAGTYTLANRERSLDKAHPFGGSFKQKLKSWAEAGCN